jgi:hypothetical protein
MWFLLECLGLVTEIMAKRRSVALLCQTYSALPKQMDTHTYKTIFRWLISLFGHHGATRAIMKANKLGLSTYYPIRTNIKGDVVPLWRNYLMIEFRDFVTIDLCRNTPHFIKLISARDPNSDYRVP